MVKEKEEVEVKESEPVEVGVYDTIKEKGTGLQMPDGTLLEINDVSPGHAQWMAWVTRTLNEIKRGVA